MFQYIDSLILFILCLISYPYKNFTASTLLIILLALVLQCFTLALRKEKQQFILGFLMLIPGIFYPSFCCFAPYLSYQYFYRSQFWFPGILFIEFLYGFISKDITTGIPFFLYLISLYMAFHSAKTNRQATDLFKIQDENTEREMILSEHNRILQESQDNEVYIATLKERNRIAREIHDNVGHLLSRSILQVGALLTITDDNTTKPILENLNHSLNTAMDSIRNSVHDLHDESIHLEPALQEVVNNFSFCPVKLEYDAGKKIPKNIKYCFLAIAKEGLHNIEKHSNATHAQIIVREHPGFYQLLIEDNGNIIPDNPQLPNKGIGLANMQSRVDALHGIFRIQTDEGFRIFISIPKEENLESSNH